MVFYGFIVYLQAEKIFNWNDESFKRKCMYTEKNYDKTAADIANRTRQGSGWSRIPTQKNTGRSPDGNQNHEAEEKIYTEPDNPSDEQYIGGPGKPSA